ncbi:hypothetical protein TRFO_26330 [Tritrichomonas foetus]|uniref:Uncharacterized protein n=1 Tax=Tritrichomonas foetus TaxID=1144522 RepID=A0A1J4K4D2_9EUKA|nr:hypothetical protein TRFO_26330 [Tritrichomonas foetus]|eukprot:OHT05826.1 hypothetical protein TRFO_26330 [Tritrichomonas foetus]
MWRSIMKSTVLVENHLMVIHLFDILMEYREDELDSIKDWFSRESIVFNDALILLIVDTVFTCSEYKSEFCQKYAKFLYDLNAFLFHNEKVKTSISIKEYLLNFISYPKNLKNNHCLILLNCLKMNLFDVIDFHCSFKVFFDLDYKVPETWLSFLVWFGHILEIEDPPLFTDCVRQYINAFNRLFSDEEKKKYSNQFLNLWKNENWLSVTNEEFIGKHPNDLYNIIKEDDVKKLQELFRNKKININQRIEPSILELHSILMNSPTLLQCAAFFKALNCLDFLIKKLAKVSLSDKLGLNVIHYAAAGGSYEILDYLKRTQLLYQGAIHFAAAYHNYELVETLYNNDPDFLKEYFAPYGTILHMCAASNNVKTAAFCLDHGSNINARNDVSFHI